MTGQTLIEKVIPNAKIEDVLSLFYDALKQYSRYLYYEKILVNGIEVLHSHNFLDINPPNNNRIVVTDILVPEARKKGEVRKTVRIDALIINAWQIQEDRLVIKIEHNDFFKNIIKKILDKFNFEDEVNIRLSPRKKKNVLPKLPSKKADAFRWVRMWELIGPKIDRDSSLKSDYRELNEWLRLQNADEDLIRLKEDTLRSIIRRGSAGKIPSRTEFERKKFI